MQRRSISAPGAPPAVGPYSHAVVLGNTLYCSAQLPLVPATGDLDDQPAEAQTLRCLRNLEAVCAAAGTSMGAAVRVTLYLTDLAAMPEVNAAYGTFFGDDPPARVAIGVAALPRGARVAIDAIVELGATSH